MLQLLHRLKRIFPALRISRLPQARSRGLRETQTRTLRKFRTPIDSSSESSEPLSIRIHSTTYGYYSFAHRAPLSRELLCNLLITSKSIPCQGESEKFIEYKVHCWRPKANQTADNATVNSNIRVQCKQDYVKALAHTDLLYARNKFYYQHRVNILLRSGIDAWCRGIVTRVVGNSVVYKSIMLLHERMAKFMSCKRL